MVADFVIREGIDVIVRSVRDEGDLSYERQMAAFNKERCGKETVFFSADDTLSSLSSTLVRQTLATGGDIESMVPAVILDDVLKKGQTLQKKANND